MKNRNNRLTRLLAVMLCVIMTVLTFTGCGKSGGGETSKKEFVYVPEYVQVDFEVNYIDTAVSIDDAIYLSGNSWDEDTGESKYYLYKYNVADGKMDTFSVEMGENDSIGKMAATPDGNLALIVFCYDYETDENGEITDYSQTMELRVISGEDGTVINSQDLSPVIGDEDSYVQQFCVDGKGNYYLFDGNQMLHVVGPELQKICDISVEGWINNLFASKEGDVYMCSYGETGLEAKKIDLETKAVGAKLEGLVSGYGNQSYYTGLSKSIMVSGDEVSLYDVAAAKQETLFCWLDVDLNSNYIQYAGELSDGRIWAIYNDYSTSSETNTFELILLKKTKASEVAAKEEITYGALYLDWNVKQNIINFNKTNEKYRVVVKEYETDDWETGVTQFNADLTTGNCPDIIDLSSVNYTQYANKGVLADLYPYMEKSGFNKADYLENILEAYEVDGKLYGIVPQFYISTTMAKQSVVGDIQGWTLSEMLDFIETQNPDNVFPYGYRDSIFYYCIYNNIDEFIDWKTGKCSFDGPDFIRTLEFAANFPDSSETIVYSEEEGISARLRANKILLMQQSLGSVQEYQMMNGLFGEKISYVGYPNNEREGNLVQGAGGFLGISAKSKNKDAAWEFVSSMISEEYQQSLVTKNGSGWGFPIKRSALEKMFERDMTPDYYEDENGEQVEQMKTSWGYDDFNMDIYAATQEEVDEVRSLIESVHRMSGSVDQQLMNIITEETAAFFKGQKSAADTAAVIQNRIQIYVNENR